MKTACRTPFIALAIIFIITGCTANRNTITQVSTIDALLAGAYDGSVPCSELTRAGDFGIGTFDGLDGEMIILDGTVYQVTVEGKVMRPAGSVTTPFATVSSFERDDLMTLPEGTTYLSLKAMLDRNTAGRNLFWAVKVKGHFTSMKTRSVPAQEKPYPPLAEVTKDQAVFHLKDISGTMVGFRTPAYVKGINVPGYHLHFLSEDACSGGHVLDFELARGNAEIDFLNRFVMLLPDTEEGFGSIDLGIDRSKELKEVEQ